MKELKIYLKAHIRKFVMKHHPGKEPLYVDEKSMLGNALMNSVIDKRKYKFDKAINAYDQELRIIPTLRIKQRSPRAFKLVRVNIELEKWFRQSLLVWVSAQVAAGVPASASCKDFLLYYKIDDNELSFDAVHKIWLRRNGESAVIKKLNQQRQ